MSNINFANPWLLLLGIVFALVAIVPYVWAVKKENKTKNNFISFSCHLIISILLTFTIAHTTYEYVITETNVYVLADVSYSSKENLDKIDEYISKLPDNLPKNSKLGIVCFGKDYQELVSPGDEVKSVKTASVDASATNIAKALEYTKTLFKDNVIKRIVIISDGKETNESNIVSVVEDLISDGIYIDAIYLDNNLNEESKEVQINQAEYNKSVYLNDEEKVNVLIESSFKARVIVSLHCDGVLLDERAITTEIGFNTVNFRLNTSISGKHSYEVKVSCDDDESLLNNSYYFSQEVSENVKVMFIASSNEDKEAFENYNKGNANVDYYINDPNVPFTMEELSVYDEFVLSNVDIRTVYNHTQFVSNLGVLVSEYGKTLTTFGNTYIQNNEEDETLQSLSNLLPVKYGSGENDDKLVTIVMDISRSMEQISKLIIEKEIVCSILDNLEDDTLVTVIAFFGETKTVFLPSPASDRESLKTKIRELTAYQGTFMGSALSYVYDYVIDLNYSKNEVILISDGRPYGEQESLSIEYANKLAVANIVISCVHVVTEEGSALMKQIASIGRGAYHRINDVKQVESLVLDGLLNTLTDVILQSNPSEIVLNAPNDNILKDVTTLPNINGLYNNKNKTDATVVLKANYKDITDYTYEIPLLAYWNYGKGKVTSFASTISGDWINSWKNINDAEKLFSNTIIESKPKEKLSSSIIVQSEEKGTLTTLTVKVPSLTSGYFVNAKVVSPNGEIIEKQMIFNSQDFTLDINTDISGKYECTFTYGFGDVSYTSDYIFYVSYLPEYNRFTVFEASNLYYMVSHNGQVSEDGTLVLENDNSIVQKYVIDFTPIFMAICAALFITDVIIRKLRLQDIISLFKKIKKDSI